MHLTLYNKQSAFRSYFAICGLAYLLLLSGCNVSYPNTQEQPHSDKGSGSVIISVQVGKIGVLAKKQAIDLARLVLTLSCPGQDTVRDTTSLSGVGGNDVQVTIDNLKAPHTWTVSAATFDGNDVRIHFGLTSFTTVAAQTVTASLSLIARYSMLQVSFNDIPDSVNTVRMGISNVDTLESGFEVGSTDTAYLKYDYLEADKEGIEYDISLYASGSVYGNDTVLYAADTVIVIKSGVDANYRIVLKWVGPNISPGAVEMTVTIGSIGTTLINAGFGSIENEVPIDGLVAYYPFNGNANDESGNGNDGIVYGATLTSDRSNTPNKSYLITGKQYISLNHLTFNGLIDFSLVCWVKLNAINSDVNMILGVANSSEDNEFNFYYDFPNGFGMDIKGKTYMQFNSGKNIEDLKWHFVALTRKASNGSLFIDGVKVNTTLSFSGEALIASQNGVVIGQDQDKVGGGFSELQNLSGSIDDMRIYNRVLTETEIQALYHENLWTGN